MTQANALQTNGPAWVWAETRSGRWQVSRAFTDPAFLRRLDNPSMLLDPPAKPLRADSRPRVTHLVSATFPEYPGTPIVIKQYHYRNLWQCCKDLLRPGRGRRAFERAHFLEQHQIPTAKPIAAGQVHRAGLPGESYFLAEHVPNARPLRQLRRATPQIPAEARTLVRALGHLMAQLHNARLSHTDPSLSNFLVRSVESGAPQLVVVDVDGLRPVRQLKLRVALADLRRLLRRIPMSPRERLWFLAQYCRGRTEGPGAATMLEFLAEP